MYAHLWIGGLDSRLRLERCMRAAEIGGPRGHQMPGSGDHRSAAGGRPPQMPNDWSAFVHIGPDNV